MIVKNEFLLPYLVFSILFGASLFVYGFFPISFTSDQRAELKDLPDFIDDVPLNKSIYQSHVSRVILMVIDALRSDFVQHQQNSSMKFTNKVVNDGSACLFNLIVEAPTVTMPRIKAMTTGTIPNFIDVVLNLGSSELRIDSLLHQTYDKGNKIVFCGDNTWVKMFPEMFHRKLENQDSLFVNDFYEGDKNITQKLSAELKRLDWDMLILHFLGLDHIGHVEGPFSSKIATKLKEMDTIIMHIHLAMQEWKKSNAKPPLLIVTGDHGMRDTGGHGGSSFSEINVPLILIGLQCNQNGKSYKQIDIAPTLSVLFGLPIPASSIGTLIPHLLTELSMEQQLFAYYYNGKRLLEKLVKVEGANAVEAKELYIQFRDAEDAHKTFLKSNRSDQKMKTEIAMAFRRAKMRYIASSKEMSEQLTKLYVNYDDFSISMGLACLTMSLICISLLTMSSTKTIIISCKFPLLLAIIGSAFRHMICERCSIESGFCGDSNFLVQTLSFAMVCFVLSLNIDILVKLCWSAEISRSYQSLKAMPMISYYLLFGIIFLAISYGSSSFIEEEHQTWYYLTSTAFCGLYLMETCHLLSKKTKKIDKNVGTEPDEAIVGFTFLTFTWILMFSGHLLARRLNQTGDKWINEPDVGDWLQMDDHRLWNSLFVSASLLLMYLSCMDFGSILTNVLTLTACMLIYYFRTLSGSVFFAGIKESESTDTCLFLFWLNIFEIAAINFVPVLYKAATSKLKRYDIKLFLGTIIVILTLISALTHKPHNIFLVAVLLYTCNTINHACSRLLNRSHCSLMAELFIRYALYIWIGKQSFFYQGNSNSLATIDLSAGYIGLKHFDFLTVGTLLTLNTFSGPILSYFILIYNLYDCNEAASIRMPNSKQQNPAPMDVDKSNRLKSIVSMLPLLAILIAFPFTLYSYWVLTFRNHIFVWSVFSPKLLYEFYYLYLMMMMWFCMYLIPNLE